MTNTDVDEVDLRCPQTCIRLNRIWVELSLRKFCIDSTHGSGGFPRNGINLALASCDFPRDWCVSTNDVGEKRTILNRLTIQLWVVCMLQICFVFICAQVGFQSLLDFNKALFYQKNVLLPSWINSVLYSNLGIRLGIRIYIFGGYASGTSGELGGRSPPGWNVPPTFPAKRGSHLDARIFMLCKYSLYFKTGKQGWSVKPHYVFGFKSSFTSVQTENNEVLSQICHKLLLLASLTIIFPKLS